MVKKKSSLTLGRKKWSGKAVKSRTKINFSAMFTTTCALTRSPKKSVKRMLTPMKSPFKSPLYKHSPYIKPPSKKRIKTSRSLFVSQQSLEDENLDLLDSPQNIHDDKLELLESQHDLIKENPETTLSQEDTLGEEQSYIEEMKSLVPGVMQYLSENNGLDKTMFQFFKQIHDRKFPVNNIAFLLWTEVVKWFQCESTSQMRYSSQTKMFWKLGWRIFGGRFVNFMSGYKNRDETVLGISCPGAQSPQTSVINFAVPDIRVLRSYDKYNANDNWKPGINIDVMKTISANMEHKSACLTFDGKKLKQGLTENTGDVDLLGFETHETLEDRKNILKQNLEEVENLSQDLSDFEQTLNLTSLSHNTKEDVKALMLKSLKRLSNNVISAKKLRSKKEYCRDKLIERGGQSDWRKGKYVYAISAVIAFLYDIEKFITRAKEVIEMLCRYVSFINEAKFIIGSTINLSVNASYVGLSEVDEEFQNSRLIKQRSPEWFDIRKKAMVTGSTLFKAIGLEGIGKEKDHFEKVVCGIPEKDPSEKVKAAMQHGTDNEDNAVGTVVGKVLPVMEPKALFFEEGCVEMLADTGNIFMVVSPDGSLRTDSSFDSTFAAIELKCPVLKVHTEFPPRYLLQCLAEIEALGVKSLIYVSWTLEESNVFKVERDDMLFKKAMKIAYDIYMGDKVRKPTKLTDEQKDLKAEIIDKSNSVEFIGTFSSLKSDNGKNRYSSETVTIGKQIDLLHDITEVSKEFYELNRERASEAVVFLVADLDRSWEKERLRCAPVAWFPKGYSLQTETMRKIAEEVHTKCAENNIKVPCESFDGQWHGIVVRTQDGKPQTLLQLQKVIWSDVEKMKKSHILSEIKKANRNPRWTSEISLSNGVHSRSIHTLNSETPVPTWRPDKKFREKKIKENSRISDKPINLADVLPESITKCAETSATVLACTPVDDQLQVDAFSSNVNEEIWVDELDEILNGQDIPNTALQEGELEPDIHDSNIGTDDNNNVVNTDTPTKTCNDYLSEQTTSSANIQGKSNISVTNLDADHILSLFRTTKNCNKKEKWSNIERETLLERFESTGKLQLFLDLEIRIIVKYLKKSKGINIKESSSKQMKIKELAKVLGLEQDNEPLQRGVKRVKAAKTLQELAGDAVSRLPKHELNVTYAEHIWPECLKEWKNTAPGKTEIQINDSEYEWFYIPEFNEKRQQYEVKCIDSTHLLTRTRRKSCKGGLEGLSNEAWLRVANTSNSLLTRIMVEEITDPMSVDMAMTHFSEPVENIMRAHGDYLAADLCQDIRSWWISEDKAGIAAKDRIELRTGLRKRLLHSAQFNKFPPPTVQVHGWPLQLWEAILANMDAKALLYTLCHDGTYNVRAFSSMIGETFFSELTLNDKRGQGTVTTEEFGRFIGNSIEQLQMRIDPERNFAYSTKRATAYRLVEDVYEQDKQDSDCKWCMRNYSTSIPSNIETRNHIFDSEGRKRLHGRRRDGTVSLQRNAVQRGALGVRWEKARKNEAKMLPTKRMGLE